MAEVRPIDANALETYLRDTYCDTCNNYNGIRCRSCELDDAFSAIDDAPDIDYEPIRHSQWIYNPYEGMPWCECINCGFVPSKKAHKECKTYCPNCGAKMDGGKDDE